MASGKQIALQPALAEVLAQNLHHAAVRGKVIVRGENLRCGNSVRNFKDVLQAVGGRFIGADDAEIPAVGVQLHDVAQKVSHDARGLGINATGFGNLHGVVPEIGHHEVAQQEAAIGVRIGSHAT